MRQLTVEQKARERRAKYDQQTVVILCRDFVENEKLVFCLFACTNTKIVSVGQ